MPIRDLIQGPIRWLEGSAPKNDRVLSTRIRLARNVAGVRFVGKALPGELEGLRERAFESAGQVSSFRGAAKVRMEELPLLDRQFLLERHLVSHDLTGEAQARGLVLDPEEKLSLLVNEEDHLRIQALYPGFQLEEAFERARIADQELEKKLQYAIHPELGYLTACPTNVGTGMRASVLVHLPGLVLSQRIKKILTGIQQVGLTVRGFYGEGSEVVGNFFQISNQVTLGESEEETLGKLEQAIGQLLEWENRSQEGLLRDAGLQVEDKILRALGTLKYSRLLGSQELIGLLSAVRFGHTLGMRNVPSIAVLNDLLLKGQPAHLQRIAGREMSSEERNAFRAARVQKALGVEDVLSLQAEQPERRGTGRPGAPETGRNEEREMHDKFTERVRKVIFLAREEASRLQHDSIGTEHLLLGLLREGEGIAATVLSNLGLDLDQIRQAVESMVAQTGGTLTIGEIPFTSNAKRVLELSVEEARQLGHNYVGTEHLLLGLIREGEGVAAKVLADMGVDRKKVREETLKLLGGHPQQQQGAESEEKADTPSLNQFGRDLTQLAREGKLDPIFGREGEIERVVQILCRRKKNNPILIGEPGVGKTAIAEGLAQRIVEGKVPELLRNHRLITLDLASVVAGTKYRGQFEERLKNIMNEIRESQDTIIFIDELHTIVGAGGAEGAIDASNMLKPALARGELQCIGATTLDEYRKYIEKDGALERRFQTVMVDPPSLDTTIQILKGLRDKYEAHHRIHYSDQALVAAVKLSDRFITDRHLPDKAIDVIDEAGARARLSVSTLPNELRDLDAKIEKVASEKEASIRAQEFEKAASFRDKEKELRQEYYRLKKEWNETKSTRRIEVTDDDIAVVISSMTKIPVSRLEEKEQQKLVRMEEELGAHIIGQEEAVQAIARAVRRNRAGLRDPRRPIGTFVFLGPTGVGKTELARVIAKFLFDDPDSLIRIDMSEYMEKFSVSRLVGAPPGYVGYEEGGQLTEKVRRKPYSVVLLDEIEKAHPDVFNILLQVFEDGVLTDSLKRKVSFKNTVIIMTSNIGARQIRGKGKLGFSRPDAEIQYGAMKDTVMDEVKKVFNPEFLNRIDEIIVFRPLEKSHIEKIVEILLGQVRDRLAEQEMAMSITPGAMGVLIDQGYDPDLGARPLRRAIQKLIEDPLAEMVLKGRIKSGSEIRISKKGNEIAIDEKTSLEPAPEVTHQE